MIRCSYGAEYRRMRAERRHVKAEPPAVRRPNGRIAAYDALTALTSGQAKQQSNPDDEPQNGRFRRSICCMFAGLLTTSPIWIAAYMGEHYRWEPHGIVLVTVIGVMIAGAMWLYDEILGH
jgi:hypothetical protein